VNVVPTEFVRVMPEKMKAFAGELYRKVGMSDDRASLIADLQVQTDLRGVFSHGTRTSATYLRQMRDGKVNANPEVRTVQEGPATAVLDGDGGVGHFASWQAAHLAVDKAREIGLAAVATRNHHHFGPAGIYSRVPLEAGLVGYATSSHFRRLTADSGIMAASGASPLSWAVPAGDQPPIVLDMASGFGLRRGDDFEDMFSRVPAAFFKSLGLGAVCHCLGGILAGICSVGEAGPQWPASNQGAMILAIDIGRFADPETYRRQMDEFLSSVRGVRPFPGEERAMLPGWLEWERTEEWTKIGIPVGPDHANLLGQVAEELGVDSPF
jgi:LDH2 family malate/lactate/ureidoglycolate dehydrogenase